MIFGNINNLSEFPFLEEQVKECFEYLKEMGPSGSAKPQKYLEFEATITADDVSTYGI